MAAIILNTWTAHKLIPHNFLTTDLQLLEPSGYLSARSYLIVRHVSSKDYDGSLVALT